MLTRKINTGKDVVAAIKELELKIKAQENEMRFQVNETKEALKPQHLFKNTFSYLAEIPEIKKTLLSTAIGLALGYVVKKSTQLFSEENISRTLENFVQHRLTLLEQKKHLGLLSKAITFVRKFTPTDSPVYSFVKYKDGQC